MTMNRALDRARRRPVVFLLVYGAFLVLIAITASAQAFMTSTHLGNSVLASVGAADRAIVGTFVEAFLEERDLTPTEAPAERYELLETKLRTVLNTSNFEESYLLSVEIVDPNRRVLFSSTAGRRGSEVPREPLLDKVLAGDPDAELGLAVRKRLDRGRAGARRHPRISAPPLGRRRWQRIDPRRRTRGEGRGTRSSSGWTRLASTSS